MNNVAQENLGVTRPDLMGDHRRVSPPTVTHNILLVEDDEELAGLLAGGLGRRGYQVSVVATAEAGLEQVAACDYEAVLTDLQMEGMDGIAFAERVVANRNTPVIVLTGHSSLDNAIGAIRAGVYDFLPKPVTVDALAVALERAVRHKRMADALQRLEKEETSERDIWGIVGTSAAVRDMRKLISKVAPVDISVLISGESGTGKELVAKAIHEASGRQHEPFVAINCAALPDQLLESELFGHVRGAFTDAKGDKSGLFVEAGRGTLFLDEIAEMPMGMQSKLLRSLQEGTVRPVGSTQEVPFHARIVAATNRDIEQEIEEGGFREDLFYRLNVVGIDVPPLRARENDVLALAQHFVEEFAQKLGRPVRGVSRQAAERLMNYQWPGNVRELANCLERAVVLTQFDHITVEDLPDVLQNYRAPDAALSGVPENCTLEQLERLHIERVLKRLNNNKSQASQALGIDRRTLYRKLRRYGLTP